MNFLDTKRNILYCSRACALAEGVDPADLEPMSAEQYQQKCDELFTEENGLPWGATCNHCEETYHGFTI